MIVIPNELAQHTQLLRQLKYMFHHLLGNSIVRNGISTVPTLERRFERIWSDSRDSYESRMICVRSVFENDLRPHCLLLGLYSIELYDIQTCHVT